MMEGHRWNMMHGWREGQKPIGQKSRNVPPNHSHPSWQYDAASHPIGYGANIAALDIGPSFGYVGRVMMLMFKVAAPYHAVNESERIFRS